MKIIAVLFACLLFSKRAVAATYFDFTSDDYLVNYDGEVSISLHQDLSGYSEDVFRVRPVSYSASVFIYNEELEEWLRGTESWLKMPKISNNISVKISCQEPSDVFLEIQNINTSEIYLSAPKKYYPYFYLQKNFRNPVLTIPIQSKTSKSPLNKMIKYLNGIFEKN